MAAIYPGAKPAILTQFSSPSSCYSKPRSPRWSPIIINGSADFLISLQSRALRKTMYFMPGRDSAITIALGIFVPPPGLCGTGTTGFCRAISPPFGNCPVLAAILRTQSRPLLSINRSQLSKQTAPVCWPACLTYASRLILQSVVKSSGRTPRNLFRGAMQRVSIPHLSIWARSFACRINRNVVFARRKNFAARKTRERCPSRNPNRAQSDLSKDTHLSLVTAGFCSNNHPHAGVGCGFCRRSNSTA